MYRNREFSSTRFIWSTDLEFWIISAALSGIGDFAVDSLAMSQSHKPKMIVCHRGNLNTKLETNRKEGRVNRSTTNQQSKLFKVSMKIKRCEKAI